MTPNEGKTAITPASAISARVSLNDETFESSTRIPLDANVITLYRDNGLWFALYGGPHSDQIRRLFGTTVLPTPFMAITPASEVYSAVSALNPSKLVLLEATEPERIS